MNDIIIKLEKSLRCHVFTNFIHSNVVIIGQLENIKLLNPYFTFFKLIYRKKN